MLIAALHDAHERRDRARIVADAVAQVLADGRLAAGFLVGVDDLVTGSRQQRIEVFAGPVGLLGAEHQVHVGELVDEFAAPALRHAAQESEDLPPTAFAVHPDDILHLAQGLLLGHVADTAGVQQHDVGLVFGSGQGIAAGQELGRDSLAVPLVHLATVGLDVNAGHGVERRGRPYRARHREATPKRTGFRKRGPGSCQSTLRV